MEKAKNRHCLDSKLTFDYTNYANKISTLESYIGQSSYSAMTQNGEVLEADDPEKLLKLSATSEPLNCPITELMQKSLQDINQQCQDSLLRTINERNLGYFDQEITKLEVWADDLKLGLEQQIKDIDQEIKETRRMAATAAILEEKLGWQKKQRELESKLTKMRKELFERQDDIEAQRNELIEQLEGQLEQQMEVKKLFMIEREIK